MTRVIGVILIVLGVIGLVWGGISFTTKEEVVDIGPIEASRDVERTVPVPPILGGISLAAGVILLLTAKR